MGLFLALTFVWSWALWTPGVLTMRARDITEPFDAPPWVLICILLGGWGPSLMALVLSGRAGGRPAVKSLLSGLKRWRASPLVHLLAWVGPSVFLAAAMLAVPSRAAELGSPVWSRLQLIPLAFVAALPFGPLGEELGWRGFALPRLQSRYGALLSSLMIGTAWTFWHTPLFWAPAGTTISGSPVTVAAVGKYWLALVGLSILYTWIYNNSRGSVLLAVVFHATGNAVFPFIAFPDRSREVALLVEELAVVPVWIVAVLLVVVYGAKTLGRKS